ncbi:MAG: response regulator [Candidatus Poribacteria bacterium]|nr:MAG: response regulator [Candidatus Poribacteria bacterium]
MGALYRRHPRILLVEDNLADVRLTVEALREAGEEVTVEVARDGQEAMARLLRADLPLPDLVLLDLNLPRKSGHEVLREIRESERLGRIPVVILSTSAAPEDVERAYAAHANSYIVKPVDLHEFFRIIKVMCDYWFVVSALPE